MRQKWQKRRGFLKIHVAADVKSKQITGLEITDDHFHDSKSFVSLVEQSKQFGNVTKTLADGAYDTKDNFSYSELNTRSKCSEFGTVYKKQIS